MGIYKTNRLVAQFKNVDPTKTDQSMAHETDINVIVGRFLKTGMIPPSGKTPMYADFAMIPANLQDAIRMGRMIQQHREDLPEPLQDMPVEQLLSLTQDDLVRILTPPKKAGEQAKEKESETVRTPGQAPGSLQNPVPGTK